MTAREFRQLFVKRMAKLGYNETWSDDAKRPLLQGYGPNNVFWTVEITKRKNVIVANTATSKLQVSTSEGGLSYSAAVLIVADWAISQHH